MHICFSQQKYPKIPGSDKLNLFLSKETHCFRCNTLINIKNVNSKRIAIKNNCENNFSLLITPSHLCTQCRMYYLKPDKNTTLASKTIESDLKEYVMSICNLEKEDQISSIVKQ